MLLSEARAWTQLFRLVGFQGDKEHKIGSSDFVRCESGHVMLSNGRCSRVLPVTCKAEADLRWPKWVLASEIDKRPQHCVRGARDVSLTCRQIKKSS